MRPGYLRTIGQWGGGSPCNAKPQYFDAVKKYAGMLSQGLLSPADPAICAPNECAYDPANPAVLYLTKFTGGNPCGNPKDYLWNIGTWASLKWDTNKGPARNPAPPVSASQQSSLTPADVTSSYLMPTSASTTPTTSSSSGVGTLMVVGAAGLGLLALVAVMRSRNKAKMTAAVAKRQKR